uniref:Aprataxin n=1 Tax=Triatoma infestans TaxID=30076 RepID=A0A161MT06_TRIIF
MAWKMQLINSMKDPELVIHKNNTLTVIKDKYPKAEKHFLILPNENIIGINKLSKNNIELLRDMLLKGREVARDFGEGRKFRYGFHAIPSLQRLHLHVISDDFNSPALKTAKHWNSFTTSFFLEAEKL